MEEGVVVAVEVEVDEDAVVAHGLKIGAGRIGERIGERRLKGGAK